MPVQDTAARVGTLWCVEMGDGANAAFLLGFNEEVHQFLEGFARGCEDEFFSTDTVHLKGLAGDIDVAHFAQVDDEAFTYAHKSIIRMCQLFAEDAFDLSQLEGDQVFVAISETDIAVVAISFDADDLGGIEAVGFGGGVDEEHGIILNYKL